MASQDNLCLRWRCDDCCVEVVLALLGRKSSGWSVIYTAGRLSGVATHCSTLAGIATMNDIASEAWLRSRARRGTRLGHVEQVRVTTNGCMIKEVGVCDQVSFRLVFSSKVDHYDPNCPP